MYRCKECGAEYEEKPDYCDCGNDEFEAVVNSDTPLHSEGENSKVLQPEPKMVSQAKSDKNTPEESQKARPVQNMNFHNNDYYVPKRPLSVDSLSLTIFGFCILLSLYVIFFAFNVTEQSIKEDENSIKAQTSAHAKNIPSIDKIWNNALPEVKKEEPKKEENVENIIKKIVPIQAQKKVETPQKQTMVQPKVTKVPLTKVTTTGKKSTQKTSTVVKQQNNQNAQEQAKKAAEAAAKQKAEQERKAAEAAQIKKLQEEQAKKNAEAKAQQQAAAKQEYAAYKAQLRNTIGRKIDFTRVIGDGSCTVAFKIDLNGRLINRSFSKQSSNNTLNDAVYAAVMATPTFTPPPDAYNNETLYLYIKFSNGNFEISLP